MFAGSRCNVMLNDLETLRGVVEGAFVGEVYLPTHDVAAALGVEFARGCSQANERFMAAEKTIRDYMWRASQRAYRDALASLPEPRARANVEQNDAKPDNHDPRVRMKAGASGDVEKSGLGLGVPGNTALQPSPINHTNLADSTI